MTAETTVTCDKCGNEIGKFQSYWTSMFVERRDPNAPVPAVYMHPQPERVDICTECTPEVLGELIRNARGDSNTLRFPPGDTITTAHVKYKG
jgi:hypothetical protein